MLKTVAILLATLLSSFALPNETFTTVPKPQNARLYPNEVSISQLALTDPDREDPYSNDNSIRRKVMISLYFPVSGKYCSNHCQVRYMPWKTARATSYQFLGDENACAFDDLAYSSCCATNATVTAKHPLVLLEPALGASRYLYGALAYQWAAGGYAVVTIDHPHDSNMVEFPKYAGNETIQRSIDLDPFDQLTVWNDTISKALFTRVDDVNFVLKQLDSPAVIHQLFSEFGVHNVRVNVTFNTKEAVIVGHGLGGTVATYLGATNPNFPLSINMGGSAPLLDKDTTKDIVFFGRSPNHRRENDFTWPAAWKHLKGKATEFDLKDAGFFDYSDLSQMPAWLSVDKEDVKGLGEINGTRAFNVSTIFPKAYFDMQFDIRGFGLNDAVRSAPEMVPYPGV
jgi:pimeloyl-ACP methyl ester carboxylesterase